MIQPMLMVQGVIWQIMAFPIHFLPFLDLCLLFQAFVAAPSVSFTGIGLKPSRSRIGISDEELFENLRSVWTSLGRQPSYGESKAPWSEYFAGTGARTRIGSVVGCRPSNNSLNGSILTKQLSRMNPTSKQRSCGTRERRLVKPNAKSASGLDFASWLETDSGVGRVVQVRWSTVVQNCT